MCSNRDGLSADPNAPVILLLRPRNSGQRKICLDPDSIWRYDFGSAI